MFVSEPALVKGLVTTWVLVIYAKHWVPRVTSVYPSLANALLLLSVSEILNVMLVYFVMSVHSAK